MLRILLAIGLAVVGIPAGWAATYYSQGSGNFSQTSVWNTQPGGGGIAPTPADLSSGTHDFIVQSGHTVTLTDNRTVNSLSVSGTWLIGQGATPDTLTVQGGGLSVAATGTVGIGSAAIHSLIMNGDLTNDGTFDLYVSGSQAARVTFNNAGITGSQSPELYQFAAVGGTVSTTLPLTIRSSVTLTNGSTFDAGTGLTHVVEGDWTEVDGSFRTGENTVRFEGPFSTVINQPGGPVAFYNLIIAKGGSNQLAIAQSELRVFNDLTVTGGSELLVQGINLIEGDLTVVAGATYRTISTTDTRFFGDDQTLVLDGNVRFDILRFENNSVKTIQGDLRARDLTFVDDNVTINDNGGAHELQEVRIDNGATVNFSNALTLTGGTIYNGSGSGSFSFGPADVTITGNVNVQNNDDWQVGGSLTIEDGANLTINESSTVQPTAASGDVLTVANNGRLQMRGADNFPDGFDTYAFEQFSRTYYNGGLNQTVRGNQTYGNLYLHNDTKTADGPLDIDGSLDLSGPNQADAVEVNLGNFSHTIERNLTTNTGGNRTYRLTSNGTVTFDGADGNQTLEQSGYNTPNEFRFNNLFFTSTATSDVRTKSILGPITVTGTFSVTNTGGSEASFVIIDPNDNTITGNTVGALNLGAHTLWRTSGATNFSGVAGTFNPASITLDPQSTIRFDGSNVTQFIPATVGFGGTPLVYGNLEFQGNNTDKTAQGNLTVRGDVRRVGGSARFVFGSFTHRVGGDWLGFNLNTYVDATTGSTIHFDGDGAQTIGQSRFHNVTFSGAGQKTINGTQVFEGNVTVQDADVLANAFLVLFGDSWSAVGAGTFTQPQNQITEFRGSNAKNVAMNASSHFGNFNIGSSSAAQTDVVSVTLQSDVRATGDFLMREDRATFDLNGFTFRVGDEWTVNTGTTFQANNGTVHYDGSGFQDIRNRTPITYHNLQFSGGGEKRFRDTDQTITGNFQIDEGVVNGQSQRFEVSGNWINNGFFQHNRAVAFVGDNQTIGRSEFHDLIIAGTGIKTLSGDLQVRGYLEIESNATLDAGAANHTITVEELWRNEGTFEARAGRVVFVGNASDVFAGGSAFYNVTVNKANNNTRFEMEEPLTVGNQLRILRGFLETDENDLTVGGSFLCDGRFVHNNNNSTVRLTGTGAGTSFQWRPGDENYRDVIIDAAGITYQLDGDASFHGNRNLTVLAGTFDAEGRNVTMNGTGSIRVRTGATFDIDAGAEVRIGTDSLHNEGTLRVVGTAGDPASVLARGGEYIFQNEGTIYAQHYLISGTRGGGVVIDGGTIDATDNFSNGAFNNGTGNAYLTLDGQNFSDFTVTNVTFGAGPTYNVSRTSGTGIVTFEDAGGALAGEINDNENPANESGASTSGLVQWTFPGGFFWDGGGDGTTWNDANNWDGNTLPGAGADVVLNHASVTPAYTVLIDTDVAVNRLRLAGGGTPITTNINGGTLTLGNGLTVSAGDIFAQAGATDSVIVGGNWDMDGTYQPNTATAVMRVTNGTHTITSGGQAFNNLIVDADGAAYLIEDALTVNDVELRNGTLRASSGNATVNGDWIVGSGTFEPGSRVVTFAGAQPQDIGGGAFYDVVFFGAGAKTLTGNLAVDRNLTLSSGTSLDAGNLIVSVGGNWNNNATASAFAQTGNGAVILTGVNQNLQGTSPTAFANLTVQGAGGTKRFVQSATVVSNFNLLGSTTTRVDQGASITGTGADNTLNMNAGSLDLYGANNFPAGFEEINLTGGTVRYRGDIDQMIFPAEYNALDLRRVTAGISPNTVKTAGGSFTAASININDVDTELDMAGHTLTLKGNFGKANGSPDVTWNGGTLLHKGGNWNIDADLSNFHNLVLSGTGTKRLQANTTVAGDLTVQNGVLFDMDDHTAVGTAGGNMTVTTNASVYSAVLAANGVAFPTNFGTYDLSMGSTVRLDGSGAQTIDPALTYGRLQLYTNGNATFNGDLDVNGNFQMNSNATLVNGGNHTIRIAGGLTDLRRYSNPTGAIVFDGDDQVITRQVPDLAELLDYIDFNNVTFSGTGIKTITNGDDYVRVRGNVTVGPGVTVNTNRPWDVSGAEWVNNGTFNHTGGTVNFDGTSAQTIRPGDNHNFSAIRFSGGGAKTIADDGLHVGNGDVTIDAGTNVELGSLTHRFASDDFFVNGSWNTLAASFIFDRTGTQRLPASLAAERITTAGSGDKDLTGPLFVRDLTIGANTTLDVTTSNYGITVGGDWTSDGGFAGREGAVAFEAGDATPKTIASNGGDFFRVTFNQISTNAATYTMQDNLQLDDDLIIGGNATLDLNGRRLRVGQNDADPEEIIVQADGTLSVDNDARLEINAQDGDAPISVSGTLELVGQSGAPATLRASDGTGLDVDILSGGTIAANFYLIDDLADEGFVVAPGATIDPVDNFSNGTWEGMRVAGAGGGARYYLVVDNTIPMGANPVENVNFRYDGTPNTSTFNVARAAAASGQLVFDGNIGGELGGEDYEQDPGDRIDWPAVSLVTWTGAVSTDWFTAGNWSPAIVPTPQVKAIIPLAANNPVIQGDNGQCRDLRITDGLLRLSGGNDLAVESDVVIGDGGGSAILEVTSAASDISVGGNWSINNSSTFLNGNSTVIFNALSGNASVQTRFTSPFHDLIFNGAATFQLSGMPVEGSITINSGTLVPSASGTLRVAGDFINTGGSITASGTVRLNGANQTLRDLRFNRLEVEGSGTKTVEGLLRIDNVTIVRSGAILRAGTSGTLDMNNDVTIEVGGTFHDGGRTHTFSGDDWYGDGSHAGTGTVVFDRNGTQRLHGGSFHSLTFEGSGSKELRDDVALTGDLTLLGTTGSLLLGTHQITGAGTFTAEAGRNIFVNGTNNFPAGFATYDLDAASNTYYDAAFDQTVRGATYGNLRLRNNTTKTLGGNIVVRGLIEFQLSTLDVSANNYQITIGGNWLNNGADGSFNPRLGTVVFNGAGLQEVENGDLTSADKEFYNMTIDKASGQVRLDRDYNRVRNDLRVENGEFNSNSQTVRIGGDLIAQNGTFVGGGTYNLNQAGGTAQIRTNNSALPSLTISGGAEYTLQDELRVNGRFQLNSGTLDADGQAVALGGTSQPVTIAGTYQMGAGGSLSLGDNVAFTVSNGGTFEAVGTALAPNTVTRRSTGRYGFVVDGTIAAAHTLFEYMDGQGIRVSSTGTIDVNNNFSFSTFTNGAGGGTFLNIENSQTLTGADRIEDVSFPDDPGGGTSNVQKSASVGEIEFYNANGPFAGETFDNDVNDLITWTGIVTRTWTGAQDNNWFNANNWSASNNTVGIPTAAENVVIDPAVRQPLIAQEGAEVNNLVIRSSTTVTIETTNGAPGNDLTVGGELTLNGTLIMTNAQDTLEVQDSWVRGGAGNFLSGQGTVVFNLGGAAELNNGTLPFRNLIKTGAGTLQLTSALVVRSTLRVAEGTLDVTTANRAITVRGNFRNEATFLSRQGTVTLAPQTATTVALVSGGSDFHRLTVAANAAATVQMSDDATVAQALEISSGTLALNGRTLTVAGGTNPIVQVQGTLSADANATLRLGNNATVDVASGGQLNLIGTGSTALATVTRASSGRYGVDISSGGTLAARFYRFEYLNAAGLRVLNGATLDPTNDLSEGTFVDGATGGRYLLLNADLPANDTITNVTFGAGPTNNVRRAAGTNPITFNNAFGELGGEIYEDDPGNQIFWTTNATTFVWDDGAVGDNNWNNPINWDVDQIPTLGSEVIIPAGSVIRLAVRPGLPNPAGLASMLTVEGTATLEIDDDMDLQVDGDFSIEANGVVAVDGGSNSTITVGGNWTNQGTFTAGSSEVIMVAESGTVAIQQPFANAFCTLRLNSGGAGAGTATFNTASVIEVDCGFFLEEGTLNVTNPSHVLEIGGEWHVSAPANITGLSTLSLDGIGNQDVTHLSTADVTNLVVEGSGTKRLLSSFPVLDEVIIQAGSVLDLNGQTLSLGGNWVNNGGFSASNGTVVFDGSNRQTISTTSSVQTFHNVVIDNAYTATGSNPVSAVDLNSPVTITGQATFTDGLVGSTSVNILTFGGNATVGGTPSASSYVIGPVRKVGDENFTFPIGTADRFARIGISGMNTSSTFQAEYFDEAFSQLTPRGSGVSQVSQFEYWDLNRVSGGAQPFVSIYWEDNTFSGIDDVADLIVAHWTSTEWESKGQNNSARTGTLAAGSITSNFRFDDFSPITFGSSSTDNTLPVSLEYFRAEVAEEGVWLRWQTASELNNEGFTVERSTDGLTYEAIGYQRGAGNTREAQTYALLDTDPVVGVSYYRLVQTDFDGASETFEPVMVHLRNGRRTTVLRVFPNPAPTGQRVQAVVSGLSANEPLTVTVATVHGQELRTVTTRANATGAATVTLPEGVASGIYFVTIRGVETSLTQRLVVE